MGNLLQIIVFILVAVATGHLSDREKERHRSIIEAQKLATLGRATLAMTSELQEVLKSLRTLESSTLPLTDRSLNETMRGAIEKILILNEILSKFRPGQESRQRDIVEIGGAIERAREKVGKLAKARDITVKTHVDTAFGMLRINREDLIWILEELIKNASSIRKMGRQLPSEPTDSRIGMKLRSRTRAAASPRRIYPRYSFRFTQPKKTGLDWVFPFAEK